MVDEMKVRLEHQVAETTVLSPTSRVNALAWKSKGTKLRHFSACEHCVTVEALEVELQSQLQSLDNDEHQWIDSLNKVRLHRADSMTWCGAS